jgi:hypothetical protein
MDGACPTCGKSVFGDVKDVFDNGPVPPKQGVSSAGRLNRSNWRTRSAPSHSASDDDWVRYADELIASSRSNRRPERGPLRPVNTRADRSWLEDSITAVSRAEDVYIRCQEDLEAAQWQAKQAQAWIDDEHLHERALPPAKRHEYVQAMSKVSYARGCFAAYEVARDRYFALLNDLAEASKIPRSQPLLRRGGFEDIDNPYRDTRKDDGSLAFAMRQHERAERDRHHESARGFNTDGMHWE